MAKHNAHIIDGICELLWRTIAEGSPQYLVRGQTQVDTQTQVLYTSFTVAQSFFPANLRNHIDAEVERQITAFYEDLDVVCKAADDPKWGRCFVINLLGELDHMSWDQFRNRRLRRDA